MTDTSAARLGRPSSVSCPSLSPCSAALMDAIFHVISIHWLRHLRHHSVSQAAGVYLPFSVCVCGVGCPGVAAPGVSQCAEWGFSTRRTDAAVLHSLHRIFAHLSKTHRLFTDEEQLRFAESTGEIIKTTGRIKVCVFVCVCWGADKRPVEHLDAGDSSAHTRYEPN